MSERVQWSLVGTGNLGTEVMRQLGQSHVANRLNLEPKPLYVVRHNPELGVCGNISETCPLGEPLGFRDLTEVEELPDVTFIAVPSNDEGSDFALRNISHVLQNGKIAVTAEKSTLAKPETYSRLREESDNFARLGINATVGGGTRMLDVAYNYCQDPDNISQIHLVLNGTMSAIMSYVAPQNGQGMSVGQAVELATNLGYAEPGEIDLKAVVKGETTEDIPKKLAIFINHLGLCKESLENGDRIERLVNWKDLDFQLSDEDIASALEESRGRRLIVSMYSKAHMDISGLRPEKGRIGGFDIADLVEEWELVAGFRNVDRNPLFSTLAALSGPAVGVVIGLGPNEQDGFYSFTGPGAGRNVTVNTMLDDYVLRRNAILSRPTNRYIKV